MSDFMLLTADGLQRVEKLLFKTLQGTQEEENVNAMCMHVVRAGGKRLRPRLTLLSAAALLHDQDGKFSDAVERLAAAVELLHTASLIHDDVIDKASLRRGCSTLNETDGNHAAVLAGDYMFTRCFVLLHTLNCMPLFDSMAQTVSALVTGELDQLKRQGDLSVSKQDYCRTVYCKTGALFELACSGSAILFKRSDDEIEALKKYGRLLGQGFQVADDLLDYQGRSDNTGKDVGEDLADGRITLPLIFALRDLCGKERADLEDAAKSGDFLRVRKTLDEIGALKKTQEFALQSAKEAAASLEILPKSPYRDALCEIALKAARRSA